jgi:hypothetical protein
LASAKSGIYLGKKLEAIKVKGKSKPIEIYQITGVKK